MIIQIHSSIEWFRMEHGEVVRWSTEFSACGVVLYRTVLYLFHQIVDLYDEVFSLTNLITTLSSFFSQISKSSRARNHSVFFNLMGIVNFPSPLGLFNSIVT